MIKTFLSILENIYKTDLITIIIIGGISSWITLFLKSKIENLREMERRLNDKRWQIYIKVLEPYFILFSDIKGKGVDNAIEKINTSKYRQSTFELNIFGSDEVVRANNKMYQFLYKNRDLSKKNTVVILFGKLILEIRKSIGNKKTKLDEIEMLESCVFRSIRTAIPKASGH